jgi:hypothetical protein
MAKKQWRKPIVSLLEAGSAEASTKPGNDGAGGQTAS